jgi:hypothetical protein
VFVSDPHSNARFCHHLGVPTQADKVGAASLEAARYARPALVATLLLGIPSLLLAIIAILK